MTISILTLNSQYALSTADRLKITSQSDNPSGKIPSKALIQIERERLEFAKSHDGNSF